MSQIFLIVTLQNHSNCKEMSAAAVDKNETDLKQTRRRLSVMSDNKLVEGLGDVNLNDKEESSTEVNFRSAFPHAEIF